MKKLSAVERIITSENNMAKHPGFKAVQAKIAKSQGISSDRAGAILAAGAKKASKAAVKANPRLKKVSGMASGGMTMDKASKRGTAFMSFSPSASKDMAGSKKK